MNIGTILYSQTGNTYSFSLDGRKPYSWANEKNLRTQRSSRLRSRDR